MKMIDMPQEVLLESFGFMRGACAATWTEEFNNEQATIAFSVIREIAEKEPKDRDVYEQQLLEAITMLIKNANAGSQTN